CSRPRSHGLSCLPEEADPPRSCVLRGHQVLPRRRAGASAHMESALLRSMLCPVPGAHSGGGPLHRILPDPVSAEIRIPPPPGSSASPAHPLRSRNGYWCNRKKQHETYRAEPAVQALAPPTGPKDRYATGGIGLWQGTLGPLDVW